MVSRTTASQPGTSAAPPLDNAAVFSWSTYSAQLPGAVIALQRFLSLTGSYKWSDSGTNVDTQQVVTNTGVIKNMYVYLEVAPGAGAGRKFVLRVNAVESALAVTISGASVSGSDTTNEVAVVPGDLVDIITYGTAAGVFSTASRATVSTEFNGGTTNYAVLMQVSSLVVGATTAITPVMQHYTRYLLADEAYAQQLIPRSGTIKNLYAAVSAAPGVGQTWTVTLRVNGVNSALTCTISGAVAISANDTINEVTVTAGDKLSIGWVKSAGAANAYVKSSMEMYV